MKTGFLPSQRAESVFLVQRSTQAGARATYLEGRERGSFA